MGKLSEAWVFWTLRRSCPLALLPGVTHTDHIPSEVVPTLCSLGPGNFLASEVPHCPYNGIEAGFESLGHNQLGLLSHRDLWKARWLLVVRVNCADVFKSVTLVTRQLLCQNDRWAAAAPPPCHFPGASALFTCQDQVLLQLPRCSGSPWAIIENSCVSSALWLAIDPQDGDTWGRRFSMNCVSVKGIGADIKGLNPLGGNFANHY